MKHTKHAIALFALAMVGLVGLRTAEAHDCYDYHGYHAWDRAWAYCNLQSGHGIQCTVVQYGHGCNPHWSHAQLFTDGETAYLACY
jgi:hypothetical protein